ncbi:entericidin A/B family lipoprotein [Phenylobacterium aquaticum]|nr:entericidin A/B family lipoprotein [Phenylobacterium aquaticum]MCI3131162.1 entericidin A/B family lipoprotein [Phenylobacterium aquaticum]
MRKVVILAAVAAALLTAACNTVAGVGQDISAAGKAVSHTADKVKH